MTKEELEKEAEEYAEGMVKYYASTHEDCIPSQFEKYLRNAYISSAEPREKRIAELEEEVVRLRNEGLENINKYTRFAETDKRTIADLEAQIEKMKNCKNCANYMISGKCPCLFRTGWCKNWEMTRSRI